MLMERHISKKERRSSHKNHLKGPKKRTVQDDESFAWSFEKMVQTAMKPDNKSFTREEYDE